MASLFGGLWIHQHPTRERSSYLVLTLDFSRVATDAGPEALRRTFFEAVRASAGAFLLRYRERIPPARRRRRADVRRSRHQDRLRA